MCRDALQHDGRSQPGLDAVRQPNEPLRLRLRELGVGPLECLRRYPISDSELRDALADRDDPAGALLAGCERRRPRILTLPLVYLDEVDTGRLHPDDRLPGTRLRIGDVLQAHDLRTAGSVNANGFHIRLVMVGRLVNGKVRLDR